MSNISYGNLYTRTDQAIILQICDFIKKTRIDNNLSQEDTSLSAGISRSTLSLIERGKAPNLETLIKILRVLNRLDVLMVFKYEAVVSPLKVAEEETKLRKRVRNSKNSTDNSYTSEW